ncbi:MAG: terminase family protein [Pseudomonadota bacterium]
MKSASAWLACAEPTQIEGFLTGLSDNALASLPYLFEFWALPHQVAPEGDWRTWVIMGGRGAGKTRAGAEWVRAMVEGAGPRDPGRCKRVALVGETYDQAVGVMVRGDSGILAVSPPDRVPRWVAGERRLIWPNGAEAQVFSAFDYEALRGPQFDAAWCDELAKWKYGQEAWDMLQFGLRLGEHPQQLVTTTPRNVDVLKDILSRESTVMTHAATEANRAYLARSFLEDIRARYSDTSLGRQELDGLLLEDVDGALWRRSDLEARRLKAIPEGLQISVAVDPPVTGHKGSDECGIVVVGVDRSGPPKDWRAVVIEDCSLQGATPQGWAEAAAAAYHSYKAERMVAEVNQGGDLVETIIRQVDPMINYKPVRAARGKLSRAEPVAALYEQGRVAHLGVLAELEDQMCRMSRQGYQGKGSPDRVDALVWALTDALLHPAAALRNPMMRSL